VWLKIISFCLCIFDKEFSMSIPMASFNGVLAYGNATLASATEVCEVSTSSLALERTALECSPRCNLGQTVRVAGELTGTIECELSVLKVASGGSQTDTFLSNMLGNDELEHVWFVDEYNDGAYIASCMISSLTFDQSEGEVIKASMTLIPSTEIKRVLNGSVVSS
jgi:hypothetical protein